jgi:hypothetical protein
VPNTIAVAEPHMPLILKPTAAKVTPENINMNIRETNSNERGLSPGLINCMYSNIIAIPSLTLIGKKPRISIAYTLGGAFGFVK